MNDFDKLTQEEKLALLARLDSSDESKNRGSLFAQTMNQVIAAHKEHGYTYDKPESKGTSNAE